MEGVKGQKMDKRQDDEILQERRVKSRVNGATENTAKNGMDWRWHKLLGGVRVRSTKIGNAMGSKSNRREEGREPHGENAI
jgi:hypothetical protein